MSWGIDSLDVNFATNLHSVYGLFISGITDEDDLKNAEASNFVLKLGIVQTLKFSKTDGVTCTNAISSEKNLL